MSAEHPLHPLHDCCWYCGRKESDNGDPCSQLTYDHIHPQVKGGKGGIDNTISACLRCNNLKAASTLEEFRARWEVKAGTAVVFYGERYPGQGKPLVSYNRSRRGNNARIHGHQSTAAGRAKVAERESA